MATYHIVIVLDAIFHSQCLSYNYFNKHVCETLQKRNFNGKWNKKDLDKWVLRYLRQKYKSIKKKTVKELSFAYIN